MEAEKKEMPMEILKDLVLKNLIDFFSGDNKEQEERITEAKMAMGTLSGLSRLLATYRVKDATQFSIIKAITTNEKERKRYIEATLPGYMPKMLKGK